MSLDKAIKYGKEKRKPYYDSRRWDCTCRNHGACSYCVSTRTHASNKQFEKTIGQEEEFFAGVVGAGDPADVEMDMSDVLMKRFGFDPSNTHDMVRSGLWFNEKIEQELKDLGE